MNRLRNPRFRFTVVLGTAAALAALLIGASQLGARDAETTAVPVGADAPVKAAPARPAPSLFAGIEQRGAALGSARAPVTLVEYADLQCPYCAQWARDTMPTLVEEYVRAGKLRVVFRGLTFIGPDSDRALRTAIAAGAENHLWDVVHGLYLNQGGENTGWVTDELAGEIAARAGLDDALLERRWDDVVASAIERMAEAAQAAGVPRTPAFQVGPTGGPLEPVQVSSLGPEGIVPAIEAVLAQ
jgi:protein-disulfide isomerase